tara:strand:- start:1641 stop:2693 length:1053 start_codon:yes stop_codon:yes gene_type:complete
MIKQQPKTNSQPILSVFQNNVSRPPPIWLMRQAGRYLPEYRDLRQQAKTFIDFCHSPELAVKASLQPLERFNFDAAILFADILLIPEAMGQKVVFQETKGPVLQPLNNRSDIDGLYDFNADQRLSNVIKTVQNLRLSLDSRQTLIGFAGGVWTVAAYMIQGHGKTDFSRALEWVEHRPNDLKLLINRLVEVTSRYLIAQAKAGADVLQIFDSWAGLLNNDAYERWCIAPTLKIIKAVREAVPNVPIIGFPRGNTEMLIPYILKTGVDGISLDSNVEPLWAVEHIPEGCVVQGNLDPQVLVAGGERLIKKVKELLLAFEKRPYIFNLGHGIVPETPLENVAKLVTVVREMG